MKKEKTPHDRKIEYFDKKSKFGAMMEIPEQDLVNESKRQEIVKKLIITITGLLARLEIVFNTTNDTGDYTMIANEIEFLQNHAKNLKDDPDNISFIVSTLHSTAGISQAIGVFERDLNIDSNKKEKTEK